MSRAQSEAIVEKMVELLAALDDRQIWVPEERYHVLRAGGFDDLDIFIHGQEAGVRAFVGRPEPIDENTLTKQLIKLSESWNRYDLVPDDQKVEAARIGRELNTIGGMDAMQRAYYAAKQQNKDAGIVQAYWDGIGDWRW
jgi:hypothetical protein